VNNSIIQDDLLSIDEYELKLALAKKASNQLPFAVMLKFFQLEGRYPINNEMIPQELVTCLADQLGVDSAGIKNFKWESRSIERFRKEIRTLLGYRKSTVLDSKRLIAWLINHVLPEAPTNPQCFEQAYQFFRHHKLEPFAPQELMRYIGSAQHQFEKNFFLTIHESLRDDSKKWIDGLLGESSDQEENTDDSIKLRHLKKDAAGAKLKHVNFEIKKLDCIREIRLPALLQNISRKCLQKYYLRIVAESPSHIAEYKISNRYSTMAIFCYIRSQLLTDNLADLLIQLIQKIKKSSETHIIKTMVSEIKRVDGKFDILHTLSRIAAEHPDGIIRDTIYPAVSQDVLINLSEELRCKGNWYQTQVQTKMRSLYSHAHRQVLLPLLDAFIFCSDNPDGNALLQAIAFIKQNKSTTGEHYPDTKNIPVDSVIPSHWRSAVLEMDEGTQAVGDSSKDSSYKVNRMNYEIAVLEELRRQLRCKLIWIEGAYRYRNPDEDSPKDFDDRQDHYYKLLNLPLKADDFIKPLKAKLDQHLQELNDNILSNHKVKIITEKGGNKGKIKLSPSEPQTEPPHLKAFQLAIKRRFATINLLDILKEVDLRINFTQHFHTVASKSGVNAAKLRKRLLLCLYAIGSNTGLMRIGAANNDAKYGDLKYTKGRHIHTANVRAAIIDVVNQILEIRDPHIWGEATTGVACDSTQVSSWDQNLMTEWHPRYHGHGVMIYWHVDKNSAVIHSQLKTCTSSEVGSMITGVLKHDTAMNLHDVYADTHGQSSIGFAFSHLLGFDLLPRLKNINRQKLYYSEKGAKKYYENLSPILKESIDWQLICDNYHEVVRLVAALRTGTAEPDVIIKRFSNDNYHHPVYKALNEIGKAAKTIFLCRYLSSESLRIEIHEALNVVERLNGIMSFIFYGKLGEISTNNKDHQELAVVCLHLLQVCMVYINTLIIQEALSDPTWKNKLTAEDKRALTPLIHTHINPYGLFPLNLKERLDIERRKAA